MPSSSGLTHVAMSVPEGTLTDAYRARLLEFYGRILGWREMESLRRPDRLTVAVGRSSYINIRERPDSMVTHGYEHFGVLVRSAEDLQQLWADLANEQDDVELEPLSTNDRRRGVVSVPVSLADGGGSAVLRQSALRVEGHAPIGGGSALSPQWRISAPMLFWTLCALDGCRTAKALAPRGSPSRLGRVHRRRRAHLRGGGTAYRLEPDRYIETQAIPELETSIDTTPGRSGHRFRNRARTGTGSGVVGTGSTPLPTATTSFPAELSPRCPAGRRLRPRVARPVVLAGRMPDPNAVDEVVVTSAPPTRLASKSASTRS